MPDEYQPFGYRVALLIEQRQPYDPGRQLLPGETDINILFIQLNCRYFIDLISYLLLSPGSLLPPAAGYYVEVWYAGVCLNLHYQS